jgi:hypothetical protein
MVVGAGPSIAGPRLMFDLSTLAQHPPEPAPRERRSWVALSIERAPEPDPPKTFRAESARRGA